MFEDVFLFGGAYLLVCPLCSKCVHVRCRVLSLIKQSTALLLWGGNWWCKPRLCVHRMIRNVCLWVNELADCADLGFQFHSLHLGGKGWCHVLQVHHFYVLNAQVCLPCRFPSPLSLWPLTILSIWRVTSTSARVLGLQLSAHTCKAMELATAALTLCTMCRDVCIPMHTYTYNT